jgi:hypothetical protein
VSWTLPSVTQSSAFRRCFVEGPILVAQGRPPLPSSSASPLFDPTGETTVLGGKQVRRALENESQYPALGRSHCGRHATGPGPDDQESDVGLTAAVAFV